MNNSQQNTNGYLGTNVIENDAADFFFFYQNYSCEARIHCLSFG